MTGPGTSTPLIPDAAELRRVLSAIRYDQPLGDSPLLDTDAVWDVLLRDGVAPMDCQHPEARSRKRRRSIHMTNHMTKLRLLTLLLLSAGLTGCRPMDGGGGRAESARDGDQLTDVRAAAPTWPPPPAAIPGGVAPEDLILRLTDLPAGYSIDGDGSCGPWLSTEGSSPELDAFLMGRWPGVCTREFRQYTDTRPPDQPPRVESAVLIFGDGAAAQAALQLGPVILSALGGDSGWQAESPPTTLGDATQLLYTTDAYVPDTRTAAYAVLWRDGNLLNYVTVVGLAGDAGKRYALELATKQHGYQTVPGTAPPAANDDLLVPLDRPNLGVPVYWLGRDFEPGAGLPPLTLTEAYGPIKPGGGPGWLVDMDYDVAAGGRTQGVKLGIWDPESWAQFLTTDVGRAVWDSPCAKATEVPLSGGSAVIYAGYPQMSEGATCPPRPPDRYLAHVYLSDAVVSVNVPFAIPSILRAQPGWDDPYSSPAGMEAIVKGLVLR